MTIRHPQHIMARPPAEAARRMAALPWMAAARAFDALHWTVMPDPDDPAWSCDRIGGIVAGIDAAPFALTFDQARGRRGGTAEIYGRKVPREARRLVRSLCQAFAAAGMAIKRGVRPHVTLDYAFTGADFDQPIAPIVWEVDRLQLIESITGERRHRCLGQWPLTPRQGTLFPLRLCATEGLVAG